MGQGSRGEEQGNLNFPLPVSSVPSSLYSYYISRFLSYLTRFCRLGNPPCRIPPSFLPPPVDFPPPIIPGSRSLVSCELPESGRIISSKTIGNIPPGRLLHNFWLTECCSKVIMTVFMTSNFIYRHVMICHLYLILL